MASLVEFLGATLGSLFFGSILYGILRPTVGVFVKTPTSRYLWSMLTTAICLVLFSAWGYSNGGSMNWQASSLYIPGLIIIALVFYLRDVRSKAAH